MAWGSPWGSASGQRFTANGSFRVGQGISISHSRPFHPQTQVKDQRFRRCMKAEVLSGPPFANLAEAARSLERWRNTYNQERPHEVLDLAVPLTRHRPSPRPFTEAVATFDYATFDSAPNDIIRRVRQGGCISVKNLVFRLPKAFKNQTIALRPTAIDGVFEAYFRHQFIEKRDFTNQA